MGEKKQCGTGRIFRRKTIMRMRKKKNLVPRMEACDACWIRRPEEHRGRWRELMPGARELRVELGCGKGRFTAETAKAEPDVLLIAVEKVPDAMVVAMERVRDAGLTNVFFIDADAALLPELGLGKGAQVSAVNENGPLRGPFQHVDAPDQGGFSGAAHADDAVDLAVADGKINVLQGIHGAVGGGKGL